MFSLRHPLVLLCVSNYYELILLKSTENLDRFLWIGRTRRISFNPFLMNTSQGRGHRANNIL